MNAEQARALSSKNLDLMIEPTIAIINQKIEKMAASNNPSGNRCLNSLWYGLTLSNDQKLAITAHFRKEGFKIVDHPDPDPGHPGSSEYTTMEW